VSAAPVNVLAVLDGLIADMGDAPGTTGHAVAEARAAVAQLIAATGPVLIGGMTTVRDRMEMTRRLRNLSAALDRAGGAK